MTESLTVVPAYGRDYKNRKEVEQAWARGQDFLIMDISSRYDGKYTSIRDHTGSPVDIRIRYHRLERVTTVRMRPPGRLFYIVPNGDPAQTAWDIHEAEVTGGQAAPVRLYFRGDLSPSLGRDATARRLRRLYPGARVRVVKSLTEIN